MGPPIGIPLCVVTPNKSFLFTPITHYIHPQIQKTSQHAYGSMVLAL